MRSAVELTLGRDTDAVPKARQFVASSLLGEADATLSDVGLVVTELVTNAVLHGFPPVTVRLVLQETQIRVEVEDAGQDVPVVVPASPSSMTGRGLALVAGVASSWGVDAGRTRGKVVWAEVPTAGGPDAESPSGTPGPPLIARAVLAASRSGRHEAPTRTVRLPDVPTSLLLAAGAQLDSVVRELTLLRKSRDGAAAPPDSLLAITGPFAEAEEQIRRQALAAAAGGAPSVSLSLRLPTGLADAAETYLDALDEADRFARNARLLTLASPPSHRVLRRWYVGAIVAQLRGTSPAGPGLAELLAEALDSAAG